MRSFVLCTVLLAFAAASVQASAVKSTRSNSLQWSCDVSGIGKLLADIVSDSIAVVLDVRSDLSSIMDDALTCARKDLVDPVALVQCVLTEAETEVDAAYSAVKEYVRDLTSSVRELKAKVKQCTQL